jgi:poly-gamma-glutamate capsule biosynthesis protein CapA/YwtB (metallophosphatase superfamily)
MLLAFAAFAPAAGALAQDNPAIADDGKDVRNAVCAASTDPLSTAVNYIVGALKQDQSNPSGVLPIPRRQVFVSDAQRAGLSQKRIVLFGDWFGMPKDTPPYVGDELRAIFTRADMVINNIEAPITYNGGALDSNSDQTFNFHENVAYIKSSMAQLCIDPGKAVFTVANNHAGDREGAIGRTLWGDTVTYSPKLGATIVGIDKNPAREPEITVKDLGGGLRVGIVAWTHIQNNTPATGPVGAGTDVKGVVYPTWEASRRVFDQPKEYWAAKKAALGLKLLVGVPHWDCQWHLFPRSETVQWADELHQKGFDLVAGGHTGLMPAKVYANGDNDMTFYSLGALNNGLGWVNNYLVSVVEMVVDHTGRTLEYTVHPFVVHKGDSTFNWLRATPLCGTKMYFDKTRPSDWKLIPLDALKNTTDAADRAFYQESVAYLNKIFL